ncbi:hypothetical protein, partial [Bacillus cereus]
MVNKKTKKPKKLLTNKKIKKSKELLTIPLTLTAVLGASAFINTDKASADTFDSQQSAANNDYSTLSTSSVQSAWENYYNPQPAATSEAQSQSPVNTPAPTANYDYGQQQATANTTSYDYGQQQ